MLFQQQNDSLTMARSYPAL